MVDASNAKSVRTARNMLKEAQGKIQEMKDGGKYTRSAEAALRRRTARDAEAVIRNRRQARNSAGKHLDLRTGLGFLERPVLLPLDNPQGVRLELF